MASSNDTRSSSQGNIETRRGAMPAFQARALQTHVQLVDELDFHHVKDHLFQNGLIDHHLMKELSGMKPKEGTEAFLENPKQSGTNGYQKFLKVLQDTNYVELKLKIEETLSKQFPQNINIVLIGKTGVGKSLLGNSLLKKPAAFYSKPSFESVTKVCSLQSCKKSHHGKEVTVNIIDSPGLADSSKSTNDIIREIANCMELAKGKVHVFILVINAVERMTDEGKAPIHMLKDRYGVESEAFVLIVFTHTDQISDETNLEDWIKESTFLRETISLFKNRYCSFGKNSVDHDVKDIFNRIFTMIEENYDTYYSHYLFEAAAKNFDEQIAAEKKRLEEEKKREVDKLTKKIEDRVRTVLEKRYRKKPVAPQSLKEEQKRKEEELKQKIRDELTKEIEDELRIEYEERNRKNSVAFQSLKEEQKRKDEKFKQKLRDELTKEIEDELRIEYEERNRKNSVAFQSLKEEQKRKDEKFKQKLRDESTIERHRKTPVASQSLEEERKREVDESTIERHRKTPVASQSLKEEQKREGDELTNRLRTVEERYRKTPVDNGLMSLKLENPLASQSLKEEQKRKEEELKQKVRDELTKEIEDRVRMELEERYRKTPVDNGLMSLKLENPLASQSLKEEQKRKEEELKQKVRDELTKEIEDRVRMELEERYRKTPVDNGLMSLKLENPLASQSLKEEQKRKEEELKQKVRDELTKEIEDRVRMELEERYRKTPVDNGLMSLKLENPLASQSLKEEEFTTEIGNSIGMGFEERYRKTPIDKVFTGLWCSETDIVEPVLKTDDIKNKEEIPFGSTYPRVQVKARCRARGRHVMLPQGGFGHL